MITEDNITRVDIDALSLVYAVATSDIESYMDTQILAEGVFRDNVTLIHVAPDWSLSQDTSSFMKWVFTSIKEVKKLHAPQSTLINNQQCDLGILDIIVSFEGDEQGIHQLLKQDGSQFFNENFKHLYKLLGNEIHDQMVIVTALHMYNAKGDFCLHYHNLFFSLRTEKHKITILDMQPVVDKLNYNNKKIYFPFSGIFL